MSLKYNFGGIDGAASAVQGSVGTIQGFSESETTAGDLASALVGPAGDASASSDEGNVDSFAGTGDADGTQSGDDINIGVGELQECTISKSMDSVSHDVFDFTAMEAGAGLGKPNPGKMNIEHYFDTSSAFDGDGMDDLATYQPDTEIQVGDMDAFFDVKASEPTTAEIEDLLISSWSSGASDPGYNDGVVDAADYVVWRKGDADTVDIDLSLLAVDTGGVPVSMPEYAVMLF